MISSLFWATVLYFWLRVMMLSPSVFSWVWRKRLYGAKVLLVYDWNCARVYWPPGGIERDVKLRWLTPHVDADDEKLHR